MSHNWKNILLSRDSTLKQALGIIDSGALRMALVVDEDHKLLGTVTDGDIRRGLLRNLTLDASVCDVMNTSPSTASANTGKQEIVKMMESRELLSIPILSGGKVIGLQTLHDAVTQPKHDNPVFLMAGGFGTRLKPLTDNCPKPMLKVGEKPILQTIMESFIAHGFHQFYISLHYMPEVIIDYLGDGSRWGVDIHYVHEETPLGTGGALGLLPKELPDIPIIMMNGDLLTKVNFEHLLDYHNSHQAAATMCVRNYSYQIPYGVVSTEDHLVTSMVEKPTHNFFVNAGVYVLNHEVIKRVKDNTRVDMPTLLQQCMDDGRPVASFPIHEYWLDIGQQADFSRAQTDILKI